MNGIYDNKAEPREYTQQDRMEFYRLLNKCVAKMQDALELSDDDWTIARHIELGNHEQRPYDLTTLSQAVGIPRTTVSRRVGKLVEMGLHERIYRGRRATFRATPRIDERMVPVVHEMIKMFSEFISEVEQRQPPLHPPPTAPERPAKPYD